MSRLVDRGAITAAWVGLGMAVTIAISFLLVIPIEIVFLLLGLPAGLLIGYYANARSARDGGPILRILANGVFAGLVTGVTMALLYLGVKALFYAADNGYRDASVGPPLVCATGIDCVYARYREDPDLAARLVAEGIVDVDDFFSFYWSSQLSNAQNVLLLTLAGSAGGAVLFAIARRRPVGAA